MEPVLQIKGISISFTQYSGGLQQAELPVIRDLSLTPISWSISMS